MQYAEAETARNALLHLILDTNALMTENLEYYARLGYKEYKCALHRDARAFIEKRLRP